MTRPAVWLNGGTSAIGRSLIAASERRPRALKVFASRRRPPWHIHFDIVETMELHRVSY